MLVPALHLSSVGSPSTDVVQKGLAEMQAISEGLETLRNLSIASQDTNAQISALHDSLVRHSRGAVQGAAEVARPSADAGQRSSSAAAHEAAEPPAHIEHGLSAFLTGAVQSIYEQIPGQSSPCN